MGVHHKREMTISHKEFYRLLPYALKNTDFEILNNQITVSYSDGRITIKPGIEYERKIASLVLPVLHVEFIFLNLSEDAIKQFYNFFDRAYQRGGG